MLDLWLDKVPQYANAFCVIYIIASSFNAMSTPVSMNIFATGRIKGCVSAVSIAYLLELGAIYVILKLGYSIVAGIAMKAVLNFVVLIIRVAYAHKEVETFSGRKYLRKVFIPLLLSTFLTLLVAYPLFHFSESALQKAISTLVVFVFAIVLAYYIGLTKNERASINRVLSRYLKSQK